jgi:hypothetical protein
MGGIACVIRAPGVIGNKSTEQGQVQGPFVDLCGYGILPRSFTGSRRVERESSPQAPAACCDCRGELKRPGTEPD